MPTPAEAIAEVNRVYREFNRYSGDGKPGEPLNAPLPIGDPQSGVANPKKAELRAMLIGSLVAAGEAIEGAEAALERAEISANEAAASAAGASLVTGSLPRLPRTAIKALDTAQITVAYLIEDGREGFFEWRPGNYAARIAGDIGEAYFLKANAVAAASGAWVRTVDQISTPRTAGQLTAGVENLSHNAFVGPAGYWDPAGASNTRPSWVVGDSPANNISHYSLKLTGHYIDSDVYGSMVYGGLPNYYSAIASGAHLSHVAGKDNWTEQISSFMFTDHSDLLKDVVNRQGGHGAIIGGAYHVGAGDHVAILGGYETQVWGDSAAMVGGFKNLIGDPTRSTAEQSGTAMVGGTRHAVKGQYHGVVGGIDHKITRQTSYSAMVGGWNNSLGDTSTRSAMATVGGKDNILLASFSAALGGEGNVVEATATAAVVSGRNAVAKTASSDVLASGKFANNGDAQLERMVWYGAGVGTIIPGAGGAGGGTKPLSLGMVTQFVMRVVASRTDVPDQHWSFVVTGTAKNISGAGAIIEQTLDARHKTDAAFTVAAEVFGPNLGIRCTGAAGKTIRWLASCEFTTLNIS